MFFPGFGNKGDIMGSTQESSIFKAADEGDIERIKKLMGQRIDLCQGDNQHRTALHYALMLPLRCDPLLEARKQQVAELLIHSSPQTLTEQDDAGNTPVHLLALSGFDTLLAKAIRLNQRAAFIINNAGAYPIHLAIANQQRKTAEVLLTIPEMAHVVDRHSKNLMHHAARFNNVEVLNLLPLTGSYLYEAMDAHDDSFKRPLDIAHDFDFTEVIDWLNSHSATCSPK